jgi:hypothetical protein
MNAMDPTTLRGLAPAQRLGRIVEQIDSLFGFVDALEDTIEIASQHHDPGIISRAALCRHLRQELQEVAGAIEHVRPMVTGRRRRAISW